MSTCDVNEQTANSKKLYDAAAAALGKSLVPSGYDPELGCAISLNTLYKQVFGVSIGGDASTASLYKVLSENPQRFKQVTDPLPGDIIISPTGMQKSTSPFNHGHVGVVAKEGICSNDSTSGQWHEYYTLQTWKNRYQTVGGFPVLFFRNL